MVNVENKSIWEQIKPAVNWDLCRNHWNSVSFSLKGLGHLCLAILETPPILSQIVSLVEVSITKMQVLSKTAEKVEAKGGKILIPSKKNSPTSSLTSSSSESLTNTDEASLNEVSSRMPNKVLKKQIESKKNEMELGRMQRGMARAGKGELFEMNLLGTSANPVTHVEEEKFIPFQTIVNQGVFNIDQLKEALNNILSNSAGKDTKEIQEAFKVNLKDLTITGSLEKIKQNLTEVYSNKKVPLKTRKMIGGLVRKISEITDLSTLSKLYNKEAILSKLRILLLESDNEEIVEAIQELNKKDSIFISPEEIPETIRNEKNEWLLKDLDPYFSSYEFLEKTDFSEKSLDFLQAIKESKTYFGSTGFAFKTGAENQRELLAGKILNLLNFDDHVSSKLEKKMESTKLDEQKHPTGIGSKWVSEGKSNFHDIEFYAESPSKTGRNDLLDEEKYGSKESVQSLGIVDILLFAGDSHANQYIVNSDGHAECFDMGVFLPPSESYTDKKKTFVPFRSALLAHPFCEEKMDSSLIEKIKGWSPEEMGKQFKEMGLLENEAYFESHTKEIYEAVDSGDEEEIVQLQEECFKKIHPRALKAMKSRMARMKEYVQKETAPTVQGLFRAALPHIATITNLYNRISAPSTLYIWLDYDNRPKSLESILSELKKAKKISPEEIKEFKKAIVEIQKDALERKQLASTREYDGS